MSTDDDDDELKYKTIRKVKIVGKSIINNLWFIGKRWNEYTRR